MYWSLTFRAPNLFNYYTHAPNLFKSREYFSKLWSEKYGLKNVFENDFDALLARIKFVQDREPTSMFVGF